MHPKYPKSSSGTGSGARRADTKALSASLAELDRLIGLNRMKVEIRAQLDLVRINKQREDSGLKVSSPTRHLIFSGGPGTGKTEVARIVGKIYSSLGILSVGTTRETSRADFIAGYSGQTTLKTKKLIEESIGSILFIDEAYALADGNYGQEAIGILVKEMEDNRKDLVVIVAGYPDKMQQFLAMNPGLNSRFKATIHFDDYSSDDLASIFSKLAADSEYKLEAVGVEYFKQYCAHRQDCGSALNARDARNILETAISHHAVRLRSARRSKAELSLLRAADIAEACRITHLELPPRA